MIIGHVCSEREHISRACQLVYRLHDELKLVTAVLNTGTQGLEVSSILRDGMRVKPREQHLMVLVGDVDGLMAVIVDIGSVLVARRKVTCNTRVAVRQTDLCHLAGLLGCRNGVVLEVERELESDAGHVSIILSEYGDDVCTFLLNKLVIGLLEERLMQVLAL
jgi:hypothetical protein